MTKRKPVGEMFYLDKSGNRRDAELHEPMLRQGERIRGLRPVIDETIMAPIRERVRRRWQTARRP